MTVQSTNQPSEVARWRPVAVVLSVGAFAVGTDAFVVSGLLPDVASSFDVGVGAAGQLVTVFAIAYAVAAVPLGTLASRWSPRTALLAALTVFTVGNVLTAVAPSYPLVLAARVLAAAGAAVYTATSTATAGAAAGPRRRGSAIAIVVFGFTSSLVLGAPLGTALGSAAGWRATIWAVAALGLLAAFAIAAWAPAVRTGERVGSGALRAMLADPRVLGLLARSFVAFLGLYMPYTYVSVVYEPLTAHGVGLAVLLLVFGVTASVGNLAAGRLADRYGPHRVVLIALLLLTAAFAVVPVARPNPVSGIAIVAITGWLSFSVTTPQQHQLLSLAPDTGRQATATYQAVVYAAVSASGAVGAAVLAVTNGVGLVFVAAALTLVAALWTARVRSSTR